jgi:hypothetical protein
MSLKFVFDYLATVKQQGFCNSGGKTAGHLAQLTWIIAQGAHYMVFLCMQSLVYLEQSC